MRTKFEKEEWEMFRVLIQMDNGKLLILEMLEAGPTEIGIQSAIRAVS